MHLMQEERRSDPRRLLKKASTLGSAARNEAFDTFDASVTLQELEICEDHEDMGSKAVDAMLSPSVPGIQVSKGESDDRKSPQRQAEKQKRLVVTGAGPAVRRDVPSLNRTRLGQMQIHLDLGLVQQTRDFSEPPDVRARRDKFAYFDKQCSKILEHLYVGSDYVARNRSVLAESSITHVLNCVGFVCPEYFPQEIGYKTLWLQDNTGEDITSVLYDVFDYIEDVRQSGGRVFVHCCQGVSRSTSLCIAYLMWLDGIEFEEAFRRVKTIRGVASPNMGFACQLLQWQKRVLKGRPALPKPLPTTSAQESGPLLHSDEIDASRSSAASSGIAVPDLPYSGDSFSMPTSLAAVGSGAGTDDAATSSGFVDVATCRMYRIAPHSPYDAMHLVPKIANFGDAALDPRGAFLIQVGSTLYLWHGKDCHSLMLQQAQRAAVQFIKYERLLPGPVDVEEGREPPQLLRAFEVAAAASLAAKAAAEQEEALQAVKRQGLTYQGQDHSVGAHTATDTKDHAAGQVSPIGETEGQRGEGSSAKTAAVEASGTANGSTARENSKPSAGNKVVENSSHYADTEPTTKVAAKQSSAKLLIVPAASEAMPGDAPGPAGVESKGAQKEAGQSQTPPELPGKQWTRHGSVGRRRKTKQPSGSGSPPSQGSSSTSAPSAPAIGARHPSPLRLLGSALLGRRKDSLDKEKGDTIKQLALADVGQKPEWFKGRVPPGMREPGGSPTGALAKRGDPYVSEEEGEGGGHAFMPGCAGIMEKRSPREGPANSKGKGARGGSFLGQHFLRGFAPVLREKQKAVQKLPSIDPEPLDPPVWSGDGSSPVGGVVEKASATPPSSGKEQEKSRLFYLQTESDAESSSQPGDRAEAVTASQESADAKPSFECRVEKRAEYDSDFEYFLSAANGASPRPIAGLGSPSTHKVLPHEGRGWTKEGEREGATLSEGKRGTASARLLRYASAVGVLVGESQPVDGGRHASAGVGMERSKAAASPAGVITGPSPSSFSPRSLGMYPPSGAGAYGSELVVPTFAEADSRLPGVPAPEGISASDLSSNTDEDSTSDGLVLSSAYNSPEEEDDDKEEAPGVRLSALSLATPRGQQKKPAAPWGADPQAPQRPRAPLPPGGRGRRRAASGIPAPPIRPNAALPSTGSSFKEGGSIVKTQDTEPGWTRDDGESNDFEVEEDEMIETIAPRFSQTPRGMRSGASIFR